MFGLDNTKKLADAVQALTEGQAIDSQLRTNNIVTPIDDGIDDFNKGAEFGYPHQNHYIVESKLGDYLKSKFTKKSTKKSHEGVYHEPPPTDDDTDFTPRDEKAPNYWEATDAISAYAKNMGMSGGLDGATKYKELLFVKENKPAKLKEYKNQHNILISDDEILTEEEIIKWYNSEEGKGIIDNNKKLEDEQKIADEAHEKEKADADKLRLAINAYKEHIGMKHDVRYGELLAIKTKSPEKLEEFKENAGIADIPDEKILSNEEVIKWFNSPK